MVISPSRCDNLLPSVSPATSYKLLAEAIRSGQLSAAQVEVHMKDEVFEKWYAAHYGGKN